MRLLLVEDDATTRDHVCAGLSARGHDVEIAEDGRAGLRLATTDAFDVLIIDRMLPELDGLALVRALRTARVDTPALMLTALGGIADRVDGLRGGADDYLVKPFELEELDARLEALGRRPQRGVEHAVLARGDLLLNRLTRHATWNDQPLELTASEFAMLELLMLNAGRTVTKAMMLEQVFDLDPSSSGAIVEPHVSRLRAKLVRKGAQDPIRTMRGAGYLLV